MVLPRVLEFSSRLPVSVCGTGDNWLDSIFSRQCGICCFVTYFSLPITSQHYQESGFAYSLCLRAWTRFPLRAQHILLRQHFSQTPFASTGISTCCPSTTPCGLALGPDLPWGDEPCSGNLGLSTGEILTHLLATHASILSCVLSTYLSIQLQRVHNAPLPI